MLHRPQFIVLLEAVRSYLRALDEGSPDVDTSMDTLRALSGMQLGTDLLDSRHQQPEYFNLIYEVPSLNERLRCSERKRSKQNAAVEAQLVAQMGGRRHAPALPCLVTMKAHRHRMLDDDNLIGGLKDLLDCLVMVGLLWDDSRSWAWPEYDQELCGKAAPHVEIAILPIPAELWTADQARAVKSAPELPPAISRQQKRALAGASDNAKRAYRRKMVKGRRVRR